MKKNKVKILVVLLVTLLFGIALPKLTIYDQVTVTSEFKKLINQTILGYYDSPFEKLALNLGKSRIIKIDNLSVEIESFTIFNIPLGFFKGSPDSKLVLNFNQVENLITQTELINNDFSDSEEIDLWKTITDETNQIKYRYPEFLTAKYISTVTWPPVFTILPANGTFVCEETPAESSFPQRVSLRRVDDDKIYCLQASSEGAAGSVFTEFTYSTVWKEKVVELYFVLQYPRCDNYSDEQQSECAAERESFDLDALVDRIFLSLEEL